MTIKNNKYQNLLYFVTLNVKSNGVGGRGTHETTQFNSRKKRWVGTSYIAIYLKKRVLSTKVYF